MDPFGTFLLCHLEAHTQKKFSLVGTNAGGQDRGRSRGHRLCLFIDLLSQQAQRTPSCLATAGGEHTPSTGITNNSARSVSIPTGCRTHQIQRLSPSATGAPVGPVSPSGPFHSTGAKIRSAHVFCGLLAHIRPVPMRFGLAPRQVNFEVNNRAKASIACA